MKIQITVTRQFPSGALVLSAVINGYLVSRRYLGYSIRAAKSLFRAQEGDAS